MKHFVLMACAVIFCVCVFTSHGHAARITDVVDAVDDNGDIYDFSFSVDFTQIHEKGKISRERNIQDGSGRVILQREFDYKSIKSMIDVNLKFGLYKDLEFHVVVPVTVQEKNTGVQAKHYRDKFWASAYGDTLQGRPSLLKDQVFGFAEWEALRAGFGDMTFGVSYSAVNQERVKEYPTWVFTLDVQVPTGPEQKTRLGIDPNNSFKGKSDTNGVGKKLVALTLKTAISRRWKYVEPYFGMHYKFTFDAGGQIKDPRYEGNFLLGMEVIPYELKRENENEPLWKVAFDFMMQATIFGKGHDYNAISDPLSWRRDKDGSQYWPTDTRTTPYFLYPNNQAPEYELPIEDRYTFVQGFVGLYAILYHYLTLRTEFGFGHRTEHFLSVPKSVNSSTLRPADTDGYNTQINEVGTRVKLTDSFVFSYMFSIGINI